MPPRRSTRNAQASTSAAPVVTPAAVAVVASTSTTTKTKVAPKKTAAAGKKRTATNDDDEDDDDDLVKQPAKKRTKVAKDADADDDEEADVQNDVAKDDEDDKKDTDSDGDTKMVTVLKRGKAPVDPTCSLASTHQVYTSGDEVWDAMLNQTNIGANNNKFYVIQVLHKAGSDSCFLFTRWGRVGENGQNARKGPMPAASAIAGFKSTFKSKTATAWEARHNMVARTGKYTWIERSYEEAKPVKKTEKDDAPIPPSQLDTQVQDFCNMIFSSDLMSSALTAMNYDANKLPLGNLSKNTLLRGFAALKDLSEVLDNPNGNAARQLGGIHQACNVLSAQYYSIIPHAFGRDRPTPITTKGQLKKASSFRELELVDALGDMEITQKLIDEDHPKDANGNPMNPLDGKFQSLDLKFMDPIDSASSEFRKLQEYVTNTHGATHSSYSAIIKRAFRVERHDEAKRWEDAGHDKLAAGERLLLWHGSRSTNFAGILKQGLKIAPPEAPVTGYMFGKGVYFADAMSKSANYCHSYSSNDVGILLLCEVAAKPFFEQVHANYHAHTACGQAGKLATKGIGKTQPGDWQDAGEVLGHDELKGCWMPKGGLIDTTQTNYLQYNEYIVYNTSQIKLRYLLMVDMPRRYF
ncbi:hypothetical protein FRC17_000908 [Serendipita sp. 399]|nr:hypothetical protein FRC17_000908 [Serendipita sp. 399]